MDGESTQNVASERNLTYMSIHDELERLYDEKKLFLRHPEDGSEVQIRTVYMSREVKALVDGDLGVRRELAAVGAKAGAIFDSFIQNKRVTFGKDPFDKDSRALFARNHPVRAGVCDLRVLSPSPQLRIFGGFAAPDVFIALTYNKRNLLDFFFAVQRCKKQWDYVLTDIAPIVSENVHDYISPPVTSV